MNADASAGPPPGWRMREVEEGDLGALHALRLRAVTEHPDAFGSSPGEHPDPAAYRARHRARVAAGAFVLAAFDDEGRPRAMASLVPGSVAKEAHKGSVYGMYVAPEARGLGAGRALLAAIVARARALGLERLGLAVTAHNPARRFYERAGFEAWGVEPQALKVGGTYYDEVWMSLDLLPDPPAR